MTALTIYNRTISAGGGLKRAFGDVPAEVRAFKLLGSQPCPLEMELLVPLVRAPHRSPEIPRFAVRRSNLLRRPQEVQRKSTPNFQKDFRNLSPWSRLRDVVLGWRQLENDWDGDGAVVPVPDALSHLLTFIDRAEHWGLAPPEPYIVADGEVGASWVRSGKFATASFLPDGRFLAYCPVEGGKAIRISAVYAKAASHTDFFEAIDVFMRRDELGRTA